MKTPGIARKLALVLLLGILLPALFYTGYEVASLSSTEAMITGIYTRQLDALLFSVNQYAWDVAQGWSGSVGTILTETARSVPDSIDRRLGDFLAGNPSIASVVAADRSLQQARVFRRDSRTLLTASAPRTTLHRLAEQREMFDRLIRFHTARYRKLEPCPPFTPTDSAGIALAFVAGGQEDAITIVGMTIDAEQFLRQVLAPKLLESAGDEFILAVTSKDQDSTLFATSPVAPSSLRQARALWLFPDYLLGIRMKGSTIEELASERSTRNLILIILLDIALAAGAWIVYRSIRREMLFVKMKTDFVSNVSHELRTPLALIRMYAETLDMNRIQTESKKQEYYRTILQESERLTRLVDNILDFSKMEAGKKKYTFADVRLNDIVTEALRVYAFHLQTEGFTPDLRLDPSLPSVRGDAGSITEAVMNIIDNAVKYSGREKYLGLRSMVEDDTIVLEIEDHGIGIPPEHHGRIFETFYRVTDGLVHNVKGSGLGLSLVRHIMDAHGGSVEVQSSPGSGSLFRLRFRRSPEARDR